MQTLTSHKKIDRHQISIVYVSFSQVLMPEKSSTKFWRERRKMDLLMKKSSLIWTQTRLSLVCQTILTNYFLNSLKLTSCWNLFNISQKLSPLISIMIIFEEY